MSSCSHPYIFPSFPSVSNTHSCCSCWTYRPDFCNTCIVSNLYCMNFGQQTHPMGSWRVIHCQQSMEIECSSCSIGLFQLFHLQGGYFLRFYAFVTATLYTERFSVLDISGRYVIWYPASTVKIKSC